MAPRVPVAKSDLQQRRWLLFERRVEVVWPHMPTLDAVDDQWPPLRSSSDLSRNWLWRKIAGGESERFAILTADSKEVLGLWCSRNKTAELESSRYYNLSFVEVRPDRKYQALGSFMMGLVACRAVEVGSSAIIFATDEPTSDFYGKIGATERAVKGLQTPSKLVRMVIEGAAFTKLVERTNELLEEEQT